jgi:hypothetical protein
VVAFGWVAQKYMWPKSIWPSLNHSPRSKKHNKLLNEWSSDVSPVLSDDRYNEYDDATSWRDCVDDCDIAYCSK